MKDLHSNKSRADQTVAQMFFAPTNARHQGYEALALTQAEFDAVRTPNATGWRHFLRLQRLDKDEGEFDLKGAAEMLARLKWTPHEFIELLKATRAEVGEASGQLSR